MEDDGERGRGGGTESEYDSDSSETFGDRLLGAAEVEEMDEDGGVVDVSVRPVLDADGFVLVGEAFPGKVLVLECYLPVTDALHYEFQWMRYTEQGCVMRIAGEDKCQYLVTADDVDYFLAVEVVPVDCQGRKGELALFVANDDKKIACDPNMQGQIERTFFAALVSIEVSLLAPSTQIWQKARLILTMEGYSIKCNLKDRLIVAEKFSPETLITIPACHADGFIICNPNGDEHLLRAQDNNLLSDAGCSFRDAIVLMMRLFVTRVYLYLFFSNNLRKIYGCCYCLFYFLSTLCCNTYFNWLDKNFIISRSTLAFAAECS